MTGRDVKGSHLWRMHLIPVLGFGGHLSEVWRGLVHPVQVCKRCYVMPQPTQIFEGGSKHTVWAQVSCGKMAVCWNGWGRRQRVSRSWSVDRSKEHKMIRLEGRHTRVSEQEMGKH